MSVENIKQWQKASQQLAFEAAEAAVSGYLNQLGGSSLPSSAEIEAANREAELILKKEILSGKRISKISQQFSAPTEKVDSINLAVRSILPGLNLPAPQVKEELSPYRIAFAAAAGAIAGMMILTPLSRLLLDMQDVGTFVGAPLGAFLVAMASYYSARSKKIRIFLLGVLGAGTIFEMWQIISRGGIFRRIWNPLGRRRSAIKRIFMFIAVMAIIYVSKAHPKIDRQQHEKVIRAVIEQWLAAAVLLIGSLGSAKNEPPQTRDKEILSRISRKIIELTHVPYQNLGAGVEELFQEMKNLGFEIPENPEQFVWSNDSHTRYKTFGHVELGDEVVVENEPVIVNGSVLQKGLVRKVRGRS